MMGSGQYAKFFDNPGQAFTAQAFQQGNDILAQFFGNKALSRQIAEQSAAVAGMRSASSAVWLARWSMLASTARVASSLARHSIAIAPCPGAGNHSSAASG